MLDLLDRMPGLHDPLTLRLLLPLALSFALAGLFRLVFGPRGRVIASAAIPLSALTVHLILAGLPGLPPTTGDKIAWLTMAGIAIGLVLDLVRVPRSLSWLALILWPAVVIAWICVETVLAVPHLPETGPDGAFRSLVLIALLLGFWIAASTALSRLESAGGFDAAIMTAVAAAGLGFILLHSGLPRLGVPALALASATGGFLLWNLGRTRFPFEAAAILGGGTFLLALCASFARSADNAVAFVILALLILVFFADRSARRVPLGAGRAGRLAAPLVLAGVSAVPALAAIAVAVLLL